MLTSVLEGPMADASAKQRGVRAGVSFPDLPDDCRRMEAHAEITEGSEVRSVLRRERDAIDWQNARTARCARFYDDTRSRFAGER